MGEEIPVSPDVETEDKPTEPVESEDAPKEGEEPEQDQEAPEADGQEGEDADDASKQREIDSAVQKRLKRENRKSAKADGEAAQTADDLAVEREKNKLLTLALDQATDATKGADLPPNQDDFEGIDDPKFIEAVNVHNAKITRAMVREEVQQATADTTATQNEGEKTRAFEQRNTEHIRKSIALDTSDYDATEDAVIDIIGQTNVDHIINASDDAHLVLYYLGKNVDAAETLQDLIKNDPLKAAVQIGRLEAIAKGSPIVKANPIPDPDQELEGGSPSAGKSNRFQIELDKARSELDGGGTMANIMDVKRRAKEAGVAVN